MIADGETNVVFVADSLERKFPEVHRGLESILADHGIPFGVIPGTRDIWCRDYLPVQTARNRFVQFRYAPDYLTGRYRHLRADGEIGPTLPWVQNCVRSEIVLDGGNVVRWRDKAIVTDKIYEENPGLGGGRLREQLKELLGVRTLLVIPQEPDDPIGHADGMVRWLHDGSVVVNDYRSISRRYRSRVLQILNDFSLASFEIPYSPQGSSRDGIPSAEGNWVNFLRVGRLMVVPMFGMEMDHVVLEMLRECCPHLVVRGLACRELAKEGGVLNCVSWTIRMDGWLQSCS